MSPPTNTQELQGRLIILQGKNGLVIVVAHYEINLCLLETSFLIVWSEYATSNARCKSVYVFTNAKTFRIDLSRHQLQHTLQQACQ